MTYALEVQRDGHAIFTREIVITDPALFSSLVKHAIDAFRDAHPEVTLADDDLAFVIAPK